MAEIARIKPIGLRQRFRLDAPRSRVSRFSSEGYSRFVGTMRMVLPATALALIMTVIAWAEFQKRASDHPIGKVAISMDDIERNSMVEPRYQGLDKHGDPFTVTARVATKSKPTADVIELQAPQADLSRAKGDWFTLSADYGAYRESEQLLDLIGSVSLYHDDGFEFHTLSAHISLAQSTAEGDDPVQGQGPAGSVTSEGFRIEDKGNRVIFTGKSHLLLRPNAKGSGRK